MSNDELYFQAGTAADAAQRILKEAWAVQVLTPDKARELTRHATQMMCAATELENRAVGVLPPKDG